MTGAATVEDDQQPWESPRPPDARRLHLVIAWSLDEPWRIGESAAITAPTVLGRGELEPAKGTEVARFVRWRPHASTQAPPLGDSRISGWSDVHSENRILIKDFILANTTDPDALEIVNRL